MVWTSNTTVTAIYTVNTGLEQTGIVATLSGAEDTYGTTAPSASSNAFAIDTQAPTGSVAASPVTVTISSNTITVSTTFSKTMNTAVTPTITFSPNISAGLSEQSSSWSNASTTYTVSYIAADNVLETGIIATVSGAQDTDGNAAASVSSNLFAIETSSGNGPIFGSGPLAPGYVNTNRTATSTAQGAIASAATPSVPGSSAASVTKSYVFTQNLHYRAISPEVAALQQYLNAHGAPVAAIGLGSPGEETDYFGRLTYAALVKFQDAHAAEILTPVGLTHGSGYFGPATRAFMNSN